MRVEEIMTVDVKYCRLGTNLAIAATIMRDRDCGSVPVTDHLGRVAGLITDRDICIAALTRSRPEWQIAVEDVMSRTLDACAPTDDLRVALGTMKTRRVRRLLVLHEDGRLAGIVSMTDLVRRVTVARGGDLSAEDVVDALKSIGAHSSASVAVRRDLTPR